MFEPYFVDLKMYLMLYFFWCLRFLMNGWNTLLKCLLYLNQTLIKVVELYLGVLFIDISSHDLSFLCHKESRFSSTQVSEMSTIVKCYYNLLRKYLLHKLSLLFEWRGSLSILFKEVVVVSKSSSLCFWLFMLKLKYLPKYLIRSSYLEGDITSLLKYGFGGLVWVEVIFFFMMPNTWHLFTMIIILLQVHHVEKAFNRIWVSYSWLVTTAALSTNWNQYVGHIKFFH